MASPSTRNRERVVASHQASGVHSNSSNSHGDGRKPQGNPQRDQIIRRKRSSRSFRDDGTRPP